MADHKTTVKQAASGTECVLLHDSLPPEMGADPKEMRGSILFTEPKWTITSEGAHDLDDAFQALGQALDQGYYVAGGFTYELGYLLEDRLRPLMPDVNIPLFQVGVFEQMTRVETDAAEELISERAGPTPSESTAGTLSYERDRQSYSTTLNRLHDYILAGDIYQANFTFPVSFPWISNVWQLYQVVAPHQKVAFGAVLDLPAFKVASLSPELFFRKRGEVIESRPMKGTMRRGETAPEDEGLKQALHKDGKNRAENLMIVDLIRNDLGRMARIGSVSVENLFQVETYGTLHQMVSTVRARVDGTPTVAEIFQHLFPCGSVTGAPKIRAMEVIAELESGPRGIYTGAIGYITPERDMTMSVPIRTITLDGHGSAQMGIGSGVVADSIAEDEFDECLLKSRFLRDALTQTEGRPGLIETMRCEDGVVALLDHHKTRLVSSAASLGIEVPSADLWPALETQCNGKEGAHRVRIELCADGTWEITSTPIDDVADGGTPVVVIADDRHRSDDPLLAHKTTRRWMYDRARKMLDGVENGFDVLLFNERDELCEGAISNVFLEQDGKLFTPHAAAGLLPGIMRARIIAEQGAQERVLYEHDLRNADRVFLSNAVRGMIEVQLVD